MPSVIASYELLGTVAATATATVWKARDTNLDRTVALKQVVSEGPAADRIRAEAAVLARIRHPNIVSVYELVEQDGSLWLAEQWVDGAPLSLVLPKVGKLGPVDALALTRRALEGLGHAHDQGIVHGDVTPANILVDASGNPMLVDFGMAAQSGDSGSGGTPGFVAPEAAAGEQVTPRSDVYSAAATVGRLLLGRNVFRGSIAAVARAQRTGPPELKGIAPAVAAVLRTALSVDPAHRPADANEFLALLDEAAEKTYGPGWFTGAGLGTLGGAAATIAAGIQLGGAAVVAGSIAAPALGTLGGIAARVGVKQILVATAGTAAIVGGIVGYNALTGDQPASDNTVAQEQISQPADPGVGEPVRSTHPSAALSGTYEIVTTVISTNNKFNSGPGRELRWTLRATPVCPGANLPCSVGISTDDGGSAALFASGEWTTTYNFNTSCYDHDTGIPTGGSANVTRTMIIHMTPEGISGTVSEVATGDCPGDEQSIITGTLVPG